MLTAALALTNQTCFLCFSAQLQLKGEQRLPCALTFAVRPDAATRIPLRAARRAISVRV